MGPFATPGRKQLRCWERVPYPCPRKPFPSVSVPFGVPEKRDRLAVKAHGASIPGGKAEPCSFITTN